MKTTDELIEELGDLVWEIQNNPDNKAEVKWRVVSRSYVDEKNGYGSTIKEAIIDFKNKHEND